MGTAGLEPQASDFISTASVRCQHTRQNARGDAIQNVIKNVMKICEIECQKTPRMWEDIAERMSEGTRERMPEDIPATMLEDIPDRIPEGVPERIPDDILQECQKLDSKAYIMSTQVVVDVMA